MDYRVELDIYNGPLDLLLYLIKRDELDIHDIPIARITDSYMDYVHMLKGLREAEAPADQPAGDTTTGTPRAVGGLDINVAGDFLVMAATLMEIKSAMLLPRQPAEAAGDEPSVAQELSDPRYELVQKLLEYKRFKDAAMAMERQAASHAERFPRYPARLEGDPDEPPPVDLEEVQIWDLLAAFNKLMSEVGQRKPKYHEVTYDDTPIDLHAADIADRLHREKRLSLRQLLTGRKNRSEMVGVFLALLELIREKKILVEQSVTFGEVQITEAPLEHQRTYEHASLHLAPDPAPAPPAEESTPSQDE